MERPKAEAQEYSAENEEIYIFTPEEIRALLTAAADPAKRETGEGNLLN